MNVISYAYPHQNVPKRKGRKKLPLFRHEKHIEFEQKIQKNMHIKKATKRISVNIFSIAKKPFLSISLATVLALCAAAISTVLCTQIIRMHISTRFNSAFLQQDDSITEAMHAFVFPEESMTYMEELTSLSIPQVPLSFMDSIQYTSYTVKKGDSLDSIARRYGISLSTLIAVNNIDNARRIYIGQNFIIPNIDGLVHIVTKNESISSISSTYSIPQDSILDVNDLSSATIHAGQKLFIPGARLAATDLRKAMGDLFIQPISGWRLSSSYGSRSDPFTGVKSFHTGIDMAAPSGTPIKAALDGRVASTGYTNVYGNYVILSHDGGYQTLYAHMTSYSVKTGQRVTQGNTIGKVGNTGYSTGAHLHFTVYKNGKLINPFSVLN